jgi:hypothetical protein
VIDAAVTFPKITLLGFVENVGEMYAQSIGAARLFELPQSAHFSMSTRSLAL